VQRVLGELNRSPRRRKAGSWPGFWQSVITGRPASGGGFTRPEWLGANGCTRLTACDSALERALAA